MFFLFLFFFPIVQLGLLFNRQVLEWVYFTLSNSSMFFNLLILFADIYILLQAQVHRHTHNFREVQQCTLLSIKTGGCSEDCSYCPQSSRYDTGLKAQKLMTKDVVLEAAKKVSLSIGASCSVHLS